MRAPVAVLGLLVALLALAAPAQARAVTLVTPAGKPLGGHWQRWANEMRAPTIRRLVLDVSAADAESFCGGAEACSIGWLKGQPRETVVAPDAGRDSFYYELGHQFDWRYLTNADRRFLAREWGAPGARWLDSSASVAHGAEDGLEAVFPEIYADCAAGINDQGQDLETGFIGKDYGPPAVTPRNDTCEYLARVGVREHAAVAGWKHWTWTLSSHIAAPTTVIG